MGSTQSAENFANQSVRDTLGQLGVDPAQGLSDTGGMIAWPNQTT